MSEFLNRDSEQSPLRPIEELRAAIDAITDGNPGEPLTDELEERFIAAVAAKYNKSPEEMEHLINTIRLEDR